jgi:hypothetical protein
LEKYRKTVKNENFILAVTTISNVIKSVSRTYIATKNWKKAAKVGIKEITKGGLSYLAKYIEVYFT